MTIPGSFIIKMMELILKRAGLILINPRIPAYPG